MAMDTATLQKHYADHILKAVINPIAVRTGRGATIVDADGREYLDFTSGGGVYLLGYNNAYTACVQEHARRQLAAMPHIPHYIYYSEAGAALAAKLAAITPGPLRKLFFCNSGSEAVEGALRIARKYTRRFEFLALQQGFAGRTLGALSITGLSSAKRGSGPLLPGVHHLPAPYCYRCSLNHTYPDCDLACARYAADAIAYGTCGDVAAVVIEPILGDAGVIVPPEGYFDVLLDVCRARAIAVVVDETLTGFARTGRMFASQHWDLQPDVMTIGKAVGGGFPLGAFIVTDPVAEAFEFEDFSSTAGGNPVACAAGLATIDLIGKEGLCERAAETGDYLLQALREIAAATPLIGDVRGKGLMIGIEIVAADGRTPAPRCAAAIKRAMVAEGFLFDIFGLSTIRLTPPLIISREQVDRFIDALHGVVKQVDPEQPA